MGTGTGTRGHQGTQGLEMGFGPRTLVGTVGASRHVLALGCVVSVWPPAAETTDVSTCALPWRHQHPGPAGARQNASRRGRRSQMVPVSMPQ